MYFFAFVFSLFFLCSCKEDDIIDRPEIEWSKQKSTNFNKELVIEEQIDINLFKEQHKDWDLIITGTGLQYHIYEHGSVDTIYSPLPGDIAEIQYVISLLDGTECYKVTGEDYDEFVVDNSSIESGVQEAIKKMTIGDRAKLIIPTHLAHGLVGDMNKIPPLNTLIIDIYLIGIQI